ncbi:esterase-like activity of phytase family protein [Ancylobacter sp. 6x-1]|uniref:Esterase-like activity of phytase family protein n=1 Tax=Ancylobacter crimeensis TaxID=2579147 RepID=A0ABT0DCC9_9HYPH|nr:esterase-like activity of phytase family protein [Ancylobacter crimeensis]MCK0197617.1 esterase-like activity of phytase family protein [Ancylobacter crimeensis]
MLPLLRARAARRPSATCRILVAGTAALLLAGGLVPAAQAQSLPVNKGLVAMGRLPGSLRDSFGETFGSGSGMATIDWQKTPTGYAGSFLLLPDRGYNVEGTTDYSTRVNTLSVAFDMPEDGTAAQAALKLDGTFLLTDTTGKPLTGLDPVTINTANGTPQGGPGLPGAVTGAVSLDPEAIVRLPDGSLMISDEYGPAIYHFSAEGKMLSATLPPQAFLPMRKGKLDFSSDNPGPGAPHPDPKDPDTGRQNNQGFEGMAYDPATKQLTVVLQSATRQDGGDRKSTRQDSRALVYDAADPDHLKLTAEYVVPLPVFKDDDKTLVAAQSELTALGDGRFLLLSRDSNNGWGVKGATSLYRRVDLLDLNGATNIAGTRFDGLEPVAPKGVLDAAVTPARLAGPVVDINDNAQLARVGLHNGEPHDPTDLPEKWESMAIVPALDPANPKDVFLLVANDNDFLTKTGHQAGADYDAGADVDTLVLVYRLTLP